MAARRRRARANPSKQTWLIVGGVGALAALGVGAYIYYYNKPGATPGGNPPGLPPTSVTPPAPPTPTPPTGPTPQNYSFSTNNSGGHVTLHPGDTVAFTFPNDPNAATSALNDWFWTSSPNLAYNGRTVTTNATTGQLNEIDAFTYTGGGASQMDIAAQLLPTTGPARATSGPNPPTAGPNPGASTFQFTIVTTG